MAQTHSDRHYIIPTTTEIAALRVGDLALNPFGHFARVAEITYRGIDVHGKAFVGYYTDFGDRSGRISNSMKAGELMRTVALSVRHTSRELDQIEAELLEAVR